MWRLHSVPTHHLVPKRDWTLHSAAVECMLSDLPYETVRIKHVRDAPAAQCDKCHYPA
jgi:hypothetical protein